MTNQSTNVTPLIAENAVRDRAYITVPRASEQTGLSPELLRKVIYSGELRATRLHRRWLIAVDDLWGWVEEHGESNVA